MHQGSSLQKVTLCARTAATRAGHLWGTKGGWLGQGRLVCGKPAKVFPVAHSAVPSGGPCSSLIPSFPLHLRLWRTGE